jgi:hypothetical protein
MDWRKSRHSNPSGNCVEAKTVTEEEDPGYFYSLIAAHPKCAESSCIHLLQDSKNPGVVLAFTPEEWEAFTLGVKDGEFDLPPAD